MAIRPIRIIGDPVLRTVCDPITEITPNVKALVEDLLEGVDMDGRAGLAANQIGVSLRAFSWNIDGEIGYVLNPRIVALSEDEYQDGDEGCLSVPGYGYPLRRALGAVLRGYDVDGNAIEVSARGWLARIFQHEYDHLQGTLYVDRLAQPYADEAQQVIRERGWGSSGYTWTPGE